MCVFFTHLYFVFKHTQNKEMQTKQRGKTLETQERTRLKYTSGNKTQVNTSSAGNHKRREHRRKNNNLLLTRFDLQCRVTGAGAYPS